MPNKSKSSGNSAEHLPIKIINPKQGREVKVQPGGPPSLPFKTVNVHLRGTLSGYVRNIEEKLKQDIDKLGVVPVRVELLRKAIAKTHRPEGLFSDRTCPIIGAGKLGELFIRATSDGLKKLDERILRADSAKLLTDISTVEKIEPISPENRLLGIKFEEVFKSCPKISNC